LIKSKHFTALRHIGDEDNNNTNITPYIQKYVFRCISLCYS